MLREKLTRSLKFLYLLLFRRIKFRNREALWKLHRNYSRKSNPIKTEIGPARFSKIKTIDDVIFPGAVVLDAGCNIGEVGAYIASRGCIAYGIDVSPELVEIARKRGVFATVCPLEELTFPDNFFDVCIAGEILEHLYKPEEGIAQLYRVLKPNGKLIGSCPIILKKFSAYSKYYHIWHQHNFTTERLQQLLEKFFKKENISIAEFPVVEGHLRAHFKAVK